MNEAVVHVVDDDPAVRQSLQWLIESIGLTVRTYADAQSFLDRLGEGEGRSGPGCLVLDVRMPGLSGLDLQERLSADGEAIPIIFITAHADVPMAVRALKGGAADFIEKPFNEQDLLECVQRVVGESCRLAAHHASVREVRSRLRSLSERERQVMEQVVAGRPNKAIADNLAITSKTVEWHRSHMMAKMKAQSVPELVRLVLYSSGMRENPDSYWGES